MLSTFNNKVVELCCIEIASCSIYCPLIKNTKSFSDVDVNPLGAEAVTAEKLAVDGIEIEDVTHGSNLKPENISVEKVYQIIIDNKF